MIGHGGAAADNDGRAEKPRTWMELHNRRVEIHYVLKWWVYQKEEQVGYFQKFLSNRDCE